MKIVDNRIVKSVPFRDIHIGEVFRPMNNDGHQATAYMRIPEVEDDNCDCLNAVELDEGYLTWFEKSERVEQLNVVLHIEPKGE